MHDPLVQELESMALHLERFGKIDEARYVRQVIQEYQRDHTASLYPEDSEENYREQTS